MGPCCSSAFGEPGSKETLGETLALGLHGFPSGRPRVALADTSACSPLSGASSAPHKRTLGTGPPAGFTSSDSNCRGCRKVAQERVCNELERSGRTLHCIQEILCSCPEDK